MSEVIDFLRRRKFLLQKKETEAEPVPDETPEETAPEEPTNEDIRKKQADARRKMRNQRVTLLLKLRKEGA